MGHTARALACAFLALGTLAASSHVIGTADGDKPNMRIEITQLKRVSGNMVSLAFTIINASKNPVSLNSDFSAKDGNVDKDTATFSGVYLGSGTTTYPVARDGKGYCMCSKDLGMLTPSTRRDVWAKFPAPPSDVTKLTVYVPLFHPVEDVPIAPATTS